MADEQVLARARRGRWLQRVIITPLVAFALAAVGTTAVSAADPGDLDTTFGVGGVSVVPGGSIPLNASTIAVLPQSDGRVVLVHSATASFGPAAVLTRRTVDGRPDPTFGDGGSTVLTLVPRFFVPTAAALQGDRILVAGGVASVRRDGTTAARIAVMRFTRDGQLDTSFGRSGRTEITVAGDAYAWSIQTVSDGGIVVAGATEGTVTVSRLNPLGRPVTSYGDGGTRLLPTAAEFSPYDTPTLAPAGNGRVFVSYGDVVAGESVRRVVRLSAGGSVDRDFGSARGVVLDSVAGQEYGGTLLRQDDRVIVVTSGRRGNVLTALRAATGRSDAGWGSSGRRVVDVAALVNDGFVDGEGRILLAGASEADGSLIWSLGRLNANGRPDTTFSGDGVLDIDLSGFTGARAIVPMGTDYLVAGSNGTGSALVRLGRTGRYVTSYAGDGVADTRLSVPMADGRGALVEPDGRSVVFGRSYRNALVSDGAVWRLDRAGRLDPTFAGGRAVEIRMTGRSVVVDAVERLADGRYLVAARAMSVEDSRILLVRLLADGRLDTTFGTGGRSLLPAAQIVALGAGVLRLDVDAEGRALIGTSSPIAIHVARVSTTGGLDPAFGTNGVAAVIAVPLRVAHLTDLRVLGNGTIALADAAGRRIVRLTESGAPSEAFGPEGARWLELDERFATGLAVFSATGGVVVAATDLTGGVAVARTLPSGGIDRDFGTDGVLVQPARPGRSLQVTDVALPGNGTVLIAVTGVDRAEVVDPRTMQGSVMRITPTGAMDETFGTGGVRRIDLGGDSPDAVLGVAGAGRRALVVGGVVGAIPLVHVARLVL